MCSRVSPCATLPATFLSTLPQISSLTSCAPTDVISITSAPTLLPSLLDPCSAFATTRHLSLPLLLQHSQSSPDPGASPNLLSELTALKEDPLKPPAPTLPLLPPLDSLLPSTLLGFEARTSAALFDTSALTAPSIPGPSTVTCGSSVMPSSSRIDSVQSSWNTYRRLSAPGCLFAGLRPEMPTQEVRRFSDFSISRLLRNQQNRRASMVEQRNLMLRHANHEERAGSGRKQRTIYGASQTRVLERAFEEQQYMVGTEREMLAERLGLSEAQVRVWFQNRRSKWRKQIRASGYNH